MPKLKKRSRKKISSRKSSINVLGYPLSRRFIIFLSVLVLALIASTHIPITQALTSSAQKVLGEEDKQEENKQEEQKQEESKKQEEQKQEENKKSEEQKKEENKKQEEQKSQEVKKLIQNAPIRIFSRPTITKTKTENVSSAGLKVKTESEGNKRETEIETLDGQKIKTKVEDDGTTKIEIENGSVKLKYVIENGKTMLKAENESGEEIKLSDNDLNEIEDSLSKELEDEGVEISTASGKTTFAKNSVAASTNFPLSIDIATRQLTITTPQGQKIVTVLPDEAVKNVLSTGIVNVIDSSSDASISADLGSLDGVVKLTVRNNEPVYEIRGTKKQKLFGFIPVITPKLVFVSAKTGTPISQEQSLLSEIIDRLSQ